MTEHKNKRIWLWGIVVVAVLAVGWYRSLVFSEPASPDAARLVFVTGGSDAYWQLTVKGAEDAACDHGATLNVVMPSKDESLADQVQILSNIDVDELDGVAVSPLDPNAQTRWINRLSDKLHVVTFDSDAPLSNRQFYVGTSNFYAGQLCGQLVKEAVPQGGKIAVLVANLTKHNTSERKLGFDEEISSDDAAEEATEDSEFVVLPYLIDNGDLGVCSQNIRQTLEAHPDILCIVGMNGYHGPILLQTLESNHVGDTKLVVFDEAAETLNGIDEGRIYATVAQDPYKFGYEAVRMLNSLHTGRARELPIVGGGQTIVRCAAIRKAELPAYRQRLQERLDGVADASQPNEAGQL